MIQTINKKDRTRIRRIYADKIIKNILKNIRGYPPDPRHPRLIIPALMEK